MKLMPQKELLAAFEVGVTGMDGFRAIERIATKRALEAAAEVCETVGKWETDGVRQTADDCAKAIRAMAKEIGNV